MKRDSALEAFFEDIAKDQRPGIAHLGLYMALIYLWQKQEFKGPVIAFGREVMQLARIGSTATYQKLLHQLEDYGYIRYQPSFYKGKGSKIYLDMAKLERV